MLIQRGYRVFLDYDELKDGLFNEKIISSIKEAPIFIVVLSKGALARCSNKNDSVRNEIELAVSENKKIIPIDPDKTFDGIPIGLPPKVAHAVGDNQHSDISFGQTLGITIDFMIANRIAPEIGKRTRTNNVDEDYETAVVSIRKIEKHQKFVRHATIIAMVTALTIILVTCLIIGKKLLHQQTSDLFRSELERKYERFPLHLDPHISQSQMEAVDAILDQMVMVKEDSLWMSQYEFNRGWWSDILEVSCPKEERSMPTTDVCYGEVCLFINKLRDLTKVDFVLPSSAEWEYSARGGEHYVYAGSDNVDTAAWYIGNSEGLLHPSDGWQGKMCNGFDLFDMSGNVGELCNSPYGARVDGGQWVVCGGNYMSEANEVKVGAQIGITADAKSPTVGFRLAIRKDSKTQ